MMLIHIANRWLKALKSDCFWLPGASAGIANRNQFALMVLCWGDRGLDTHHICPYIQYDTAHIAILAQVLGF